MGSRIKTAVIGCGRRGILHIAGILADPRYELAAICDISGDAMEAVSRKFSLGDEVARYTSYEQMLREISPEMVVQALWPKHRLPVYQSCVEYGVKHMVSEKPLAPTWDDAVGLRNLAEKSDCRMSFTHQRRFSPGNRKVRELLAAGAIGDIVRIDMFAFRHLLDCGTHSLDQVWSYIGDIPIDWVMGSLDLEGQVKWFDVPGEGSFAGTLMYNNGVYGSIYVGCKDKRHDPNGVTLYGTKGYMELDWEGKLYGYYSADMGKELEDFASWPVSKCLGDNIGLMWRHIADCFISGEIDELNWRNAYNAAEVIFALYESVRRRGRVILPLNGVSGNPLLEIL
jgi:UDP-N-acetyl-2-amino-2-deoxyglucuronate dehydrogenase